MKIAIIGSGNVGGALGNAWVRAGHQVTFGMRGGAKEKSPVPGASIDSVVNAISNAEVVVLAVPWGAAPEVIAQAKDWTGKTLIDCTNPIGAGFELSIGHTTSAGEQVASLAKGARVVKAFNTTGADNMKNPVYHGKPISMLFCTDDAAARKIGEQLVRDVGFEPVYTGPLKHARYMEPLAMLWISLTQQLGRDFALTIAKRN